MTNKFSFEYSPRISPKLVSFNPIQSPNDYPLPKMFLNPKLLPKSTNPTLPQWLCSRTRAPHEQKGASHTPKSSWTRLFGCHVRLARQSKLLANHSLPRAPACSPRARQKTQHFFSSLQNHQFEDIYNNCIVVFI